MSETKGAIWKEAKHPRRSLPPMVGHARPAPSNAHTRSRVESPRGLVVGSLHVDSKKVGDKPSVCTLVRDTLVRDTYSTITLIRCFISVARNRGNRFCSPRHAIFFFFTLNPFHDRSSDFLSKAMLIQVTMLLSVRDRYSRD